MPRLKVKNLVYMLVATICLLLYYNALVPGRTDDSDNSDELVDRWIEKKLDVVLERDKNLEAGIKFDNKRPVKAKNNPIDYKNTSKREAPVQKKKEGNKNNPPKSGGTNKKEQAVKQTEEKEGKESKSEWMSRMYRVQKQRKAHLRKLCDQQLKRPLKSMDDLGSSPKQLRPLIVNDEHRFIYSIVYKVGSTNWERVIVEDIAGFKGVPNQKLFSHKALRWMPGFTADEAKKRLKNYTKFMFVRNPLSRVLSAYRDKFVDHHNPTFTKMAKGIIAKFRNGPRNDSAIDVTFPEFVGYLVNSSNARSNPHWKVIFNQNFPCELNYDIIGKLEDADQDIPFVLERVGIRNLTAYGSTPVKRRGSDEQLWARYYSTVPKDIMKKFYEVYKPDFILFGYDMPDSFSVTN